MKNVTLNVQVEINSEELKAALSRRGIKPNQANALRFIELLTEGLKVVVLSNFYDEVLSDKSRLLMYGFTFEDNSSQEEDVE